MNYKFQPPQPLTNEELTQILSEIIGIQPQVFVVGMQEKWPTLVQYMVEIEE